jgi:pyruvate formate lyase activating enzyme
MEIYGSGSLPPVSGETPIAMIGNPVVTMPGIFIGGCNLRCPYCINRSIVAGNGRTSLDTLAILNYHMVSGEKWIFVSGGEPLSSVNTPNLFKEIRARNMKVALATNGTYPDRLLRVLSDNLVDYVVMDVKTSPGSDEKYMEVCGTDDDSTLEKVMESMQVIKSMAVDCEFRTTCCAKFVDQAVVSEIAALIGKDYPYVLQYYTVHQTIADDMSQEEYVVGYDTLKKWSSSIAHLVKWVSVREV